eukprot:6071587-Pyramimonas_sp.AAC.1
MGASLDLQGRTEADNFETGASLDLQGCTEADNFETGASLDLQGRTEADNFETIRGPRSTSRSTVSGRIGGRIELSTPTNKGSIGSQRSESPLLRFPGENIPGRPASDRSVVRIYLGVLRPIGPS